MTKKYLHTGTGEFDGVEEGVTKAVHDAVDTRVTANEGAITALQGATGNDHLVSVSWDEPTRSLTLVEADGDAHTVIIDDKFIELVNDLTSTDTNKALTAAQGKVLKEMIDTASNSSVTYDDTSKKFASNGTEVSLIKMVESAYQEPTGVEVAGSSSTTWLRGDALTVGTWDAETGIRSRWSKKGFTIFNGTTKRFDVDLGNQLKIKSSLQVKLVGQDEAGVESIYTPSDDDSLVTRVWVLNQINSGSGNTTYVKKTGDNMSGNLIFSLGSKVEFGTGTLYNDNSALILKPKAGKNLELGDLGETVSINSDNLTLTSNGDYTNTAAGIYKVTSNSGALEFNMSVGEITAEENGVPYQATVQSGVITKAALDIALSGIGGNYVKTDGTTDIPHGLHLRPVSTSQIIAYDFQNNDGTPNGSVSVHGDNGALTVQSLHNNVEISAPDGSIWLKPKTPAVPGASGYIAGPPDADGTAEGKDYATLLSDHGIGQDLVNQHYVDTKLGTDLTPYRTSADQDVIDTAQNDAIAANNAKVTGDDRVLKAGDDMTGTLNVGRVKIDTGGLVGIGANNTASTATTLLTLNSNGDGTWSSRLLREAGTTGNLRINNNGTGNIDINNANETSRVKIKRAYMYGETITETPIKLSGFGVYQPASFENGCNNFDANTYTPVGYIKDVSGIVHLTGMMTGGSFNTTSFTLLANYRPAKMIIIRAACSITGADDSAAGTCRIDINSDGTVVPRIYESLNINVGGWIAFNASFYVG